MNCQNLREQQNVYHPQNGTGDVHHGFCGGGARIVGLEEKEERDRESARDDTANAKTMVEPPVQTFAALHQLE